MWDVLGLPWRYTPPLNLESGSHLEVQAEYAQRLLWPPNGHMNTYRLINFGLQAAWAERPVAALYSFRISHHAPVPRTCLLAPVCLRPHMGALAFPIRGSWPKERYLCSIIILYPTREKRVGTYATTRTRGQEPETLRNRVQRDDDAASSCKCRVRLGMVVQLNVRTGRTRTSWWYIRESGRGERE